MFHLRSHLDTNIKNKHISQPINTLITEFIEKQHTQLPSDLHKFINNHIPEYAFDFLHSNLISKQKSTMASGKTYSRKTRNRAPITILSWNIGGKLSAKLQHNKDLYKAVALYEPDIILIQEHMKSAEKIPIDCIIPAYSAVAWSAAKRIPDEQTGLLPESGRGSGGLVTYVSHRLLPHYNFTKQVNTQYHQLITCTSTAYLGDTFHIHNCYLRPHTSSYNITAQHIFEHVDANIKSIMCGDFNAHPREHKRRDCTTVTHRDKILQSFQRKYNMLCENSPQATIHLPLNNILHQRVPLWI